MKSKNKKVVKRSKIITPLPTTVKNTKIIDLKVVPIKHPKTSCKLSKNSSSPLCSKTTKPETFFDKKAYKIVKTTYA